MSVNNLDPKKYHVKNIRPTFNNRLDKLKFLIKEYKQDFEEKKSKDNEVLSNFLKTSIHHIKNEITNTLTEIQTVKMNEKEKVNRAKYCKKLYTIKTEFDLKLRGLKNKNDDTEYEDFLDFYDEIDDKLKPELKPLLPSHLEDTKWFKDYVFGIKKQPDIEFVALKFIDGTIYNLHKKGYSYRKIAIELGNEKGYRPYITRSLSPEPLIRKNNAQSIFSKKQRERIIAIYEYAKSDGIKVHEDFIKNLNIIK